MSRVLILGIIALLGISAISAIILGNQGEQPTQTSNVPIGGPFELTNHLGERTTEQDFGDKLLLIYFGFTFCPDICPAELQIVSAALDQLGKKADAIQPIFITVDPERDTVEAMADYVPFFHPRLVGLTGSVEEIEKVANAYGIYHVKEPSKDGSALEYTVNHSSIVYLMKPGGHYLDHFTHGVKSDAMAKRLSEHLS